MDRKVSPVEDKCASQPFWLCCVDCGGAVATALTPGPLPDSILMLARPFLKMVAMKLKAGPELLATIASDNPLAILGDEKLVPALFTLRCADCTVKANGEIAAA